MKTVVYYTFGDMLPTDVGNKKAMFEYFKFLTSRKDVHLVLVIIGNVCLQHQKIYRGMGAELRLISPHRRWSFCEILNKIVSRLGIDMLRTYFSGLGYRKAFREACSDADVILMTYAAWFELLPANLLKKRTIVLTHDLFFYRRESLLGTGTWWRKLNLKMNLVTEIMTLKRFRKVAVLADYEQKLLEQNGIPREDIIQIGIPLSLPQVSVSVIPFSERKYDFLLVASEGYVNQQTVRCFVERVAPYLPDRQLTFALVGGISKTADTTGAPVKLEFVRLGFVDNLEPIFAQSRIGVGTIPYGSGIKVKVVEMAMHHLPVIVTSTGAEGIPLVGEGVINIDVENAENVKARLKDWIDKPEIAQRQGQVTGQHVATEFSPGKILADLMREVLR